MNLVNICIFSVGFINLYFGIWVYYKRKENPASLWFGLLTFALFIWCTALAIGDVVQDQKQAMLLIKIIYASGLLIPASLFYFANIFPRLDYRPAKLTKLITFLPSGILILITLFSSFVIENITIPSIGYKTVNFGLFYPLYLLFMLGYFIGAFYLLIKNYKRSIGITKAQVYYVLLGTLIASVIALVTNILLTSMGHFQAGWTIGPISTIIMTIFIAYGVLKYRLMDIRIVLRSTTVYGLSALLIILLAFLIWHYLAFQTYIKLSVILIISLALFHFIPKWLMKLANKYVFDTIYTYQETIKKASQRLASFIDLEKLINTAVSTISNTLKIQNIAFFVKEINSNNYKPENTVSFSNEEINLISKQLHILQSYKNPIIYEELELNIKKSQKEEKQKLLKIKDLMKQTNACLYLPLISRGKLHGIIILGHKTEGNGFSKEELELLETLASQISVAIENARLYDNIQDLNQNLEQKVSDQTKDIRKKAEDIAALLRMKSDLLSTISHQLRTPTSIFRGMLSMVNEKGDEALKPNEREEFIEKAFASADRLVVIINSINEANELQGEEPILDLKPVLIQDIIKDSLNIFIRTAKEKKINLAFIKPKQKIPKIFIDTEWIKSALEKLIDNAVWYTKNNGKIEISVNYHKPENKVSIKIQDNGIGLTQDDKKILFTLFGKGRGAKQMNVNSSGLGLFIVKKVAEAHKGKIEVFSQGEDKGSVFTLTLPVVQEF